MRACLALQFLSVVWTSRALEVVFLGDTDPQLSCPRHNCTARARHGHGDVGAALVIESAAAEPAAGISEAAVVVLLDRSSNPPPLRATARPLSRPADLQVSRRGSADLSPSPWRLEPADRGQEHLDTSVAAWLGKRPQIVWCADDTDPAGELYAAELAEVADVIVAWCDVTEAADNYRFVLVSESHLCEDRVSDQVFEVLHHNAVPIVFGFLQYSALPPVSFLHALAMPPGYLARRVRELASDPARYLGWQRDWRLVFEPQQWFCELCQAVQKRRDVWLGNADAERCHRYHGDGLFTMDWAS